MMVLFTDLQLVTKTLRDVSQAISNFISPDVYPHISKSLNKAMKLLK